MNERIKKLLQERPDPIGYIGNWGRVQWKENVYPQLGDDLYAGVDLEKFAELIIEECIRIGQETSKDIFKMSKKEGDIFEYKSHGAEEVADNIKEYFGVEE